VNAVAAAFCPLTPLLFRHLSGVDDAVADLRTSAVSAVRDAVEGADSVVVLVPVGGREAPAAWFDPSGVLPGGAALGEQVGRHLLDLAGCTLPTSYVEVRARDVSPPLPGSDATALLVLGDGAAARRDGAPGYIDERSFAYDDRVADLLAKGDADGLRELDGDLGAALLATGRLTWPVAASALQPAAAELRWRGDPFGLSYFVALWR